MFSIPVEPLFVGILVMVRVSLFLSFMPVFGDVFVPVRVRLALGLAITLVLTPLLYRTPLTFPFTIAGFLVVLLPEALLGMAFGLVGRILFAIFQYTGNIIGEQLGFHMAQTIDPSQEQQVTVMAQLLFICALLVFFGVDAHHLFFHALSVSFAELPPGSLGFSFHLHDFFREQGARMFYLAVQMSLPIIAVIFVVNAGMGMLAKAVPQIQVFFESFIVRIIIGLFMLSAVIGFIVNQMVEVFGRLWPDLETLILLMR
jgi:flagellar biosynthetic protein FliR